MGWIVIGILSREQTNLSLSIRQDEIELRVQYCFKDGQGACGHLIVQVWELEIL